MAGWARVRRRRVLRIDIVAVPPMAADLVEAAAAACSEPGELQVRRLPDLKALARSRAACALVGVAPSGEPPEGILPVLCRRSEVVVLGVSTADGRAFLYRLRAHPTEIGELTPQLLVDLARTTRRAARRRREEGGSGDVARS